MNGYYVKQPQFEGPLDLLLDLIEREKLPINEISLATVTDDFLVGVKAMEAIDRETLAEFLVIAAQLMLIKSRSLLPHLELNQEEEESIEDLERRLALYKKLKMLASELKHLESRGWRIFAREAFLGVPTVFYPPPQCTPSLISQTFAAILRALPQLQTLVEEKLKKVISLEEKICEIQTRLTKHLEHAFSEIVKGSKEKIEIVISFLAILELAKQRLVSLHQNEPFEDIIVRSFDSAHDKHAKIETPS